MNRAAEMILNCLREKQMSQTELAKSLGEDIRSINQQLNRQKDFKAERFIEVMEHIGYRVEIVDNAGIRKVCEEMIEEIQNGAVKGNMFYIENDDGTILGIYANTELFDVEIFENKDDCFAWLISHAQGIGKTKYSGRFLQKNL